MRAFFIAIAFLTATTAGAQTDTSGINRYTSALKETERKFEIRDSIADVNFRKTLDAINSKRSDLEGRLRTLEVKQKKTEEDAATDKQRKIEVARIKFNAGADVLSKMIEYLETLQALYAGLNFQSSYLTLSNPASYPVYQANVEYLKKKIKSGFTLPDLPIPNPLLSTAYTFARAIVSTQNDKDAKISELVCVLDYTTKASYDLKTIDLEIEYLNKLTNRMYTEYDSLFTGYAASVNYQGNLSRWRQDPNIKTIVEAYYNPSGVKDDEMDRRLKDLAFNLRKIMDRYTEYEFFIKQALAYYEKFELILSRNQPACPVAAIQQELKQKHEETRTKLSNAKNAFEKAYKNKIRQSDLKELFMN